MLFVCCPLTERTTNGHQSNNKRTTDIVMIELMYSYVSVIEVPMYNGKGKNNMFFINGIE